MIITECSYRIQKNISFWFNNASVKPVRKKKIAEKVAQWFYMTWKYNIFQCFRYKAKLSQCSSWQSKPVYLQGEGSEARETVKRGMFPQ
jgi:hypothetical protein